MKFLFHAKSFGYGLCLAILLSGFAFSVQAQNVFIAKNDEKSKEQVETNKVESTEPVPTNSVLTRIGVDPSQTKPFTLNEAIRKALENNNSIEVARGDVRLAETQLRSLLGIYEPVFTITPSYNNNTQPQTTTLGGAGASGVTKSNSFSVNGGFSQLVQKGGGNYNVTFNNSRNSSSSTFSQFNPTFNTNLGVQFTQPLWRNRAID